MGKNYLKQARHKAANHNRIMSDIRDIKYVEENGRKAFEEGGKFADIVGTSRADYLIRQAVISKASGCSITERYQPTEGFQDKPWRKDPYGPWELDSKPGLSEKAYEKAMDRLKLREFTTKGQEELKAKPKEEKLSLKDRLFGKILNNANNAKDSKDDAEKSLNK